MTVLSHAQLVVEKSRQAVTIVQPSHHFVLPEAGTVSESLTEKVLTGGFILTV